MKHQIKTAIFLFVIIFIAGGCTFNEWFNPPEYPPPPDYSIPDSMRFGLNTGDTVIFISKSDNIENFDTFSININTEFDSYADMNMQYHSYEVLYCFYKRTHVGLNFMIFHRYFGYDYLNFFGYYDTVVSYSGGSCIFKPVYIGDLIVNNTIYKDVKFCYCTGGKIISMYANSQEGLLKYTDSLNVTHYLYKKIRK